MKPITFLASIAPIQSAIKTGDDGMRLTLDIPESELANAVALISLRKCVLKVEISKANPKESTQLLPKKTQLNVKGME